MVNLVIEKVVKRLICWPKQIYHVKETTAPVPGNLDMNVADEEEFSPDKLRATVERLYMTVVSRMHEF